MKTKKFFSSLMVAFAAVVLFAPAHALAAAFGVSPPWIENEHIKPGTNFVYVINLSANELAEDMKVKVEVYGDSEVQRWLNVQNKDSIVMPKGQSIVPMHVNVNIPPNAEVGQYKGDIRVTLSPKSEKIEGVMNLLGGVIAVDLNVTNQDVTDFWVKEIRVNPIVEGNPIDLSMTLKNLGNTTLSNVETKASVIDMESGKVIATGSTNELSGPVHPQTIGDVKLSVPVQGITSGKYWVDVESYKNGKSTYKNQLYLAVEPPVHTNSTVSTGVEVSEAGSRQKEEVTMKPAAPVMEKTSPDATVTTSVKVRAPLTNQLIIIVIGILIVLTVIVGKMYVMVKKKRR